MEEGDAQEKREGPIMVRVSGKVTRNHTLNYTFKKIPATHVCLSTKMHIELNETFSSEGTTIPLTVKDHPKNPTPGMRSIF